MFRLESGVVLADRRLEAILVAGTLVVLARIARRAGGHREQHVGHLDRQGACLHQKEAEHLEGVTHGRVPAAGQIEDCLHGVGHADHLGQSRVESHVLRGARIQARKELQVLVGSVSTDPVAVLAILRRTHAENELEALAARGVVGWPDASASEQVHGKLECCVAANDIPGPDSHCREACARSFMIRSVDADRGQNETFWRAQWRCPWPSSATAAAPRAQVRSRAAPTGKRVGGGAKVRRADT
mmetsp:Transcript_12102/g.28071  ORF Transcript_12102/g.28071 Transcript_12102/m.28071 type:complete len:243 (-) Transcript_12102:18-746(-)